MIPVLSRKSALFLLLGVFALLFGVVQSASAVDCRDVTGWKSTDFSCSIDYSDFGGSDLTTCEYRLYNPTSLYNTGWLSAGSCSGSGQSLLVAITVGAAPKNCRDQGTDQCKLYGRAVDNSGNTFETPGASPINSFEIDYAAPILAQVTAVPSPTNDTTPDYTFSSTESGAITYGGDCSSGTTTANIGNNTVTFNALTQGVHNNCTIRVTDAVGNQSSALNVSAFTIDVTKPEIHAFDVVPKIPVWINASTSNVAISFEVSDAGGSALRDVEVWRENPAGHIPTGWNKIGTILAGSLTLKSGSTTNYLGSYVDTVSSLQDGKTYRYGIHVNDNVGNMRTEDDNVPADPYTGGPLSVQVDKTAPNNVTGLMSTSHSPLTWKNDNTVDATWTVATDNAGGSGLDGYSFVWDTASTTLPDAAKDIEQDITAGTSPSLANGNSHYLHIRSVDNAGNWKSDAMHLGPFFVDVAAPSAPISVTYTPNPNNTGTHTVSWSGASDTGGSAIKNYDVRRSSNGGGSWTTVATNNISASWVQSPALGEGNYIYQVMTRDNADNTSAWSANTNTVVVDTTPPGTPGTPTTGTPTNDTTPTWSWAASTGSPSSYDVQWATNPAFTQDLGSGLSGTNSFTHASALAQNTWHFRVKAKDAAGNESGFSGTGTVVIDTTAPGTPNLISPSGTISTTTPTFNWNTVSDPSGVTYTLWVDNDSNFGSLTINQSGLASSSYNPSGGVLSDTTTYYWKVRAVDGAGNPGSFPAHNTFTVILNQPSASPTSPLQFKNDGATSIVNQGFTNESMVKLRASATDPDTSEMIRLFFEIVLNSGSFASPATPTTGTSCTSGTNWSSCANKIWYVSSQNGNYSSTPFTGTTSVVGLSTATGYKWQVKACDDSSACSGWVAFNAVRPNFSVDLAIPVVSTFTITPEAPSWSRTNVLVSWNDPSPATGVTDSGGSGLKQIEVWRAWDANGNGTLQPGEWNDSSPNPGTQANPIYTKTSGFTSSTSDDGSYTDTTATLVSGTYWYGLHVVDNANNIGYEPSAKKALVDKDEPTTLIDAPADSWLWRSAQQRSFLQTTDEDLESGINTSACTFEACSYEPNGTEHCKGTESRACNITTNTEEIFVGPGAAHCDYQGWGACVITVGAADRAGNTAEFSQEYNVDWEFPIVGKLYVSVAEGAQSYPIHVQEDNPTTYRVHTADDIGINYCNLYIDGILEQGPIVPSGCTTDCVVEFDNVVLPDPGGDHTYSNNFAVCYDAATLGSQGMAADIVVETLGVTLSAVPTSGSSNTLFDLVADTAGSTMPGDTTYGFDCRIDTGDCTADGNFGDCDFSITTSATSYTAVDLCQYPVTAGTYTAKVAVQRGVGTAQDTVAIGPITTNSAPTAINLSVDAPNPTDYCGVTASPPVRVRWTFSDADPGDTQRAYQIQALLRGVPVVDTGKKIGTTQEYVFGASGEQLMWSPTYAWQVKVWDNPSDMPSAFIMGPQFTTPQHAYPVANFTWSPDFPGAEELVQFTDQTSFALGSTGKTWSWAFGDGGISSLQNPTHTYIQTNPFSVTLQAADNVGACSNSQTVNVSVPFPEWQEISPF